HLLSELYLGLCLLSTHPASHDISLEVVLAFDRATEHTAQQVDLAHVRERVGDRALEELLGGTRQRLTRCQTLVELRQAGMEACDLLVPESWFGRIPRLGAVADRTPPIEQIADMREDLERRAGFVADPIVRESRRRVANGFAAAIGERGQCVTEKV